MASALPLLCIYWLAYKASNTSIKQSGKVQCTVSLEQEKSRVLLHIEGLESACKHNRSVNEEQLNMQHLRTVYALRLKALKSDQNAITAAAVVKTHAMGQCMLLHGSNTSACVDSQHQRWTPFLVLTLIRPSFPGTPMPVQSELQTPFQPERDHKQPPW